MSATLEDARLEEGRMYSTEIGDAVFLGKDPTSYKNNFARPAQLFPGDVMVVYHCDCVGGADKINFINYSYEFVYRMVKRERQLQLRKIWEDAQARAAN